MFTQAVQELYGGGLLLLRDPFLLFELVLLGSILSGGARALGLPMLFWEPESARQALAGGAVGLCVGETLFVAWELAIRLPPTRAALPLTHFLAGGMAAFALAVGLAIAVRHGLPQSTAHAPSHARKPRRSLMAPAVGRVHGRHVRSTTSAPVRFGWLAATFVGTGAFLFGAAHGAWVPEPWQPAAVFGLMVTAFLVVHTFATPAVGICMGLALVAGAYGGLFALSGSAGVAFLVLGGTFAVAGTRLHKVRLPRLGQSPDPYAEPSPYPPEPQAGPLLPFDAGVRAHDDGLARPLIVVCVSGGGIRAAAWTAAILERLGRVPGFVDAARLITGASGGTLGAAAWVASEAYRMSDPAASAPHPERLVDGVAGDALTDTARRLFFHDITMSLLPFTNRSDRGLALETAWCRNVHTATGFVDLSRPLSSLRPLEAAGRLPSLVLSPMIVEDGRRLLLTNLDLRCVTDNEVTWLSSESSPTLPELGLASRTAYPVHEVIPQAFDVRLSTAVRLSASFPYVSPATVLPTHPRRRVVDAGYFDNYGLNLACAWLRRLVLDDADIRNRVSKILVIQIRDNVSNLSINPDDDSDKAKHDQPIPTEPGAFARGVEGLTSPPQGFLTARESVMLFRNDDQLEATSELCRIIFDAPDALTTTVFEFAGDASLSWRLTQEELAGIKEQADSKGIESKILAIDAWLARHVSHGKMGNEHDPDARTESASAGRVRKGIRASPPRTG